MRSEGKRYYRGLLARQDDPYNVTRPPRRTVGTSDRSTRHVGLDQQLAEEMEHEEAAQNGAIAVPANR